MKPFISIVALLICLAAGSTFPGRTDPAAPPALPIFGTSLLEKVPDTALVAVQVRDLARRWSEIRENTAISQLQGAILCGLGIAPEDVPGLVADQAVFALAPSGSSPSLVPFVLLRPDDRVRALEVLAGFDQLALCESRDALWVGPASAATLLDRFARGAERRLADILPIDEIDVQLPGGGLARGYVNPGACAAFLAQLSDRANLELPRWIAGWLQAEFSVLRYIAFRRDVIGGAILTDAVAAFDLARLPAEISRELASLGKPARAAPMLPPGIIASLAFHPHAPAWMPWLRYLSGLDGHGPFRNLAFWMSEFEQRYRRDLERDVCAAMGEHGWFLLLEGDQIGTADAEKRMSGADIPARQKPKPPYQICRHIRQDIAKHVGRDDHIIEGGVLQYIKAERIDKTVPDRDIGLLCLRKADVPEEHIGFEYVCLVPDSNITTSFCEGTCIACDPFTPLPGNAAKGACRVMFNLLYTGIESFGIFPDHDDIESCTPHRPYIGIKVEVFPYPYDNTPVIRCRRSGHGAKKDCIS